MPVTPSQIHALVDAELSSVGDARVLSHIRSHLVEPTAVLREWDYGAPGEAFPCWSVLNHTSTNTGIAYCEFGFGPRAPWGLVMLSGSEHMSIGMDCEWYESFLEAYFESMAATDLPIWRAFRQEGDVYPGVGPYARGRLELNVAGGLQTTVYRPQYALSLLPKHSGSST